MTINLYLKDILISAPVVILVVFILKCVGVILRKIIPFGPISNSALDTVHGLFLVTFITGLLISGVFTSLIIIPFYLGLCLLLPKNEAQKESEPWWYDPLCVSGFYLFFLIHSCFFSFRDSYTLNMPYIDEFFYIQVNQIIGHFSIETNDYHINWNNNFKLKSLYHYFEIWVSLLISKTGILSPIFSFRFGAYPIFLGITSFHFLKAYSSEKGNRFLYLATALLLPILGCFATYEMMDFSWLPHTLRINLTYLSDFVPANRMKLTLLLLIFSMIFYLNKIRASFFYLPLLPGIFFWPLTAHSLSFSFAYLLITEKTTWRKKIKIVFISILSCLFFFFFGVFNPEIQASGNEVSQVFLRYKSFRIIAGTIIYDLLAFILTLAPLGILLFYNKLEFFKEKIRIFIAILIAVLIASITNAVTIGNLESFQFFINLSAPIIALTYAAGLASLNSKLRQYKSGILFFLAITGFSLYAFGRVYYNNCKTFNVRYSTDYANYLKKFRNHSWRGISLMKPDGYFKGVPHLNQTGSFIYLYRNSCITPINSSENLRIAKEDGIKTMNLSSPFLQYISKSKSTDTIQLRRNFIREKGIDFLAVHAEKNIKDYPDLDRMFTLVCRDTVSGEKLYFPKTTEKN